ncbi:hypothetical protein H0194_01515 [Corynebacterium incognita]|uniref:Or membrane protein n=1 Tax=Corynebacterium incognita TaxID=2754725 RepID=A0A7G7CQ96_9CORY|nr:hypothetical protein [Corynebacterium incognita]QNE89762.1 hypothetical protein H0194_01515 [Corynebacterium incognita]
MRSFRTAAVAGATALAVAFGGTTVAGAQTAGDADAIEVHEDTTVTGGANDNGETGGSLSSKIGSTTDATDPANGTAIFGSSKEGFGEQPAWAKIMYGATILGVVGTFIGAIVGPIYNYIHHGPHHF